jgi:2-hydroxycyclohexanecarboxyl-CoA dehydrogenase
MERFEGRTALITGGASGIGAATASRLAAEGARVALADTQLEKAKALAADLGGVAVEMDVANVESVKAGVAEIVAEIGPIDVLVNNAGMDLFGFFVNTTPEMWDVILGINLVGTLSVTHAVLPSMQERRTGTIINVASEAGRAGSPGSSIYSAAKAGVIGFTKAIALEGARYGVRSNAIAPGPIETPLLNAAEEFYGEVGRKLKQGMIDATAMKRAGEAEEVAAAVAYLASDDAAYVTGQTLNVSGGLTMW